MTCESIKKNVSLKKNLVLSRVDMVVVVVEERSGEAYTLGGLFNVVWWARTTRFLFGFLFWETKTICFVVLHKIRGKPNVQASAQVEPPSSNSWNRCTFARSALAGCMVRVMVDIEFVLPLD